MCFSDTSVPEQFRGLPNLDPNTPADIFRQVVQRSQFLNRHPRPMSPHFAPIRRHRVRRSRTQSTYPCADFNQLSHQPGEVQNLTGGICSSMPNLFLTLAGGLLVPEHTRNTQCRSLSKNRITKCFKRSVPSPFTFGAQQSVASFKHKQVIFLPL